MLLLILAWLYLYALGFIMKLTHSRKEELVSEMVWVSRGYHCHLWS